MKSEVRTIPTKQTKKSSFSYIKNVVRALETRHFGPRVCTAARLTYMLVFVAFFCILLPWGLNNSTLYWLGAAFTLGVCFFIGFLKFSKQPTSWQQSIDAALAVYEPIDKDAYLQLQKLVALDGWAPAALNEWIAAEQAALDAEEIRTNSKGPSEFLDRRLP